MNGKDREYNEAALTHLRQFETLLATGEATLERIEHSNPRNPGYLHSIATGSTLFVITESEFDRLRFGTYRESYGRNGANLYFEVYRVTKAFLYRGDTQVQ